MTVFEDGPAVAMAAADRIAAALSLGARTLVLAGGTTFGVCYQILAQRPIEWGRVTVLFGDERCVPPDHPDSNYLMARERLLDRVMPATIYRIPAELGADLAAAEYDAVVAHLRPLDLVLLGMGPDGHTASLFPGNNALHADGWAVGVHGSPKPPADRVSLTLPALRSAHEVLILATGPDKAAAVQAAKAKTVPAGLIQGAHWFLDRAAAGEG